MRELFVMWRSTRMVVLTAITAALYAATLVAFKFLSILPGVTEIRPGVAFVVLCSILFGPAGAWGAAIGNTIGDLAGGLGPGTAVGFAANLLFGLVPYKLYRALGVEDPTPRDAASIARLWVVCITASGACGLAVGWGIQAVGLWPIAFKVLANMIFATNSIVCGILCLFLLRAIYPRVAALGLRYQDILDLPPATQRPGQLAIAGIVVVAIPLGLVLGNGHEWGVPALQAASLDQIVGSALLIVVAALAAVDR